MNIRTSSQSERLIAQRLQEAGYEILKRGWPDFIAVRGSEVRIIEVKRRRGARLKPSQEKVAAALGQFGIVVEIMTP